MLHAGVGPTNVNALLTSINTPAVNMNIQKARECGSKVMFECTKTRKRAMAVYQHWCVIWYGLAKTSQGPQ